MAGDGQPPGLFALLSFVGGNHEREVETMLCRERLEQVLREEGVWYETRVHRRAFTAQDVASAERVSGYLMAKVVMVKADGKLVMVVLPAPYRVDLGRLKAALGATEVLLADEREFANVFHDCEVGAMPPFGSLYGVPVVVDMSLTRDPVITFNAGTHEETMTIAYHDYERIVHPRTVDVGIAPALSTPA